MESFEAMNDFQRPAQFRRRDFLRTSAQAATAVTLAGALPAGTALGSRLPHKSVTGTETNSQLVDQKFMEQLVLQAVDAARSAGARYAEARVTRGVSQIFEGGDVADDERLAIGVRALVDGAWGFAASTYWELDEATALARAAAEQARINASIFPRDIDLGTYPVAQGHWATPIQIDPFQIALEEKADFLNSFIGLLPRDTSTRRFRLEKRITCWRQERMVATSEGALFRQTVHRSGMGLGVAITDISDGIHRASAGARGGNFAGAGWEHILDAKLREQIPGLVAEAEADLFLLHKPVDVGRYEVVMPAGVTSSFVAQTLGNATQLDRAVGMEANAGGTSYLGPDPADHLGTILGSPLINVSANRSQPKGLATVKWDDEGVEPETFPLLEKGMFVDYQTTREQASWLAPWYQSRQRPVRSHGCAVAPAAGDFPMQHTPNLQLAPGNGSTTFDDMIQNTTRGVAFLGGKIQTDFQSRTGVAFGFMREIIKGKLGDVLDGAQILFSSAQLWKDISEIGGPGSLETSGGSSGKGQPAQSDSFSCQAVPTRAKALSIVDRRRKA